MTPALVLAAFLGALFTVALLSVIAAVDWFLNYKPARDEHREVTPGIELKDIEMPS